MEKHGLKHAPHDDHGMSYKNLLAMAVLSFIAMFILMYAMVDRLANITMNINQYYMAGLMTAPMMIIELLVMGKMYKNKKWNRGIMIASMVLLAVCFFAIRKQTAVADKQFLKSMIPHHAAAILMVRESELTDPEVLKLANDIIEAQEKEIAFMKTKLEEMK